MKIFYTNWLITTLVLFSGISCGQLPSKDEDGETGQSTYSERVKYELEGDTVLEKLYFENDKVVFMERTDANGLFLKDHRAIVNNPKSGNTITGNTYKSSLYIFGPKPCDNLMYYVSEPIPENEESKGKKMIRRYNVRNDTAYFELQVDKPGNYYYVGVIVISCDTASYPRQYQLRGEFTIE